ncbi:elongation factor 1-beta [Candidatus Woesearchaeota archaeon]|nr:elongation factor 1-beta [Candidatus Woesearchaeota archaeon]
MATIIVTFKIMPDSPEIDLDKLKSAAQKKIEDFGGEVGKVEEQPVAFGLKALNIFFVMDEKKGSTEVLEDQIADIEGVKSIEVTDIRRAIG